MELLNYFWSFLYKLGLLKKEATILLLGLDNAGKTTMLGKLKDGNIKRFIPTQRPGMESIEVGNVKICAWDLGLWFALMFFFSFFFFFCFKRWAQGSERCMGRLLHQSRCNYLHGRSF